MLIDAIEAVQVLLSDERDTKRIDVLEDVLDALINYAAGEVPIDPSTATLRARRHAGQKRGRRAVIAVIGDLPGVVATRRGAPQPAPTTAWPPPCYFWEPFAEAELESLVASLRLSDREVLILELVASAYKVREIADILHMKPKSASAAMIRLFYSVASRIEAA